MLCPFSRTSRETAGAVVVTSSSAASCWATLWADKVGLAVAAGQAVHVGEASCSELSLVCWHVDLTVGRPFG